MPDGLLQVRQGPSDISNNTNSNNSNTTIAIITTSTIVNMNVINLSITSIITSITNITSITTQMRDGRLHVLQGPLWAVAVGVRPISLLRLSLLRFVGSQIPGSFPTDRGILPLTLRLCLRQAL